MIYPYKFKDIGAGGDEDVLYEVILMLLLLPSLPTKQQGIFSNNRNNKMSIVLK